MSVQINWGIVGLGKIAHKFAQDIFLTEGAVLWAVASRSAERSEAFAARYGARHSYGRYEELTNCPDLHVVYVATPHVSHCELTLMCLQRGIPVLCEKPFAMNRREVEWMVAAARTTGTFLMEALWTRFFPIIGEAMHIAQGGGIGKLHSIKADFGFHAERNLDSRIFNKALGGSAILDVGIYPLLLSLLIFGKPDRISTEVVVGATGVDESCAIMLGWHDGRVASLYCSSVTRTEVEATIFGTLGSIHLHSRFHHPTQMTWGHYYEDQTTVHRPHSGNGYLYEIAEVMHCLRTGKKESDVLPLDFSLQLISLLDEVRASAGIRFEQDGR